MLKTLLREVVLFVACAIFTATVGMIVLDTIVMPHLVRKGEQVEVPDIVDLAPDHARQKLARYGLRLNLQDARWDESIPEGHIAFQNPKAFSKVKTRRTVYAAPSLGVRSFTVPDLRQKSLRQARLWIQQSVLTLGDVTEEASDRVKEGLIIRQTPPPGAEAMVATAVSLVVSNGPHREIVKVPNLIGQTLETARARLLEVGLQVRDVRFEFSTAYEPNVVIHQNPLPDEEVKEGTSVHLAVSKL